MDGIDEVGIFQYYELILILIIIILILHNLILQQKYSSLILSVTVNNLGDDMHNEYAEDSEDTVVSQENVRNKVMQQIKQFI